MTPVCAALFFTSLIYFIWRLTTEVWFDTRLRQLLSAHFTHQLSDWNFEQKNNISNLTVTWNSNVQLLLAPFIGKRTKNRQKDTKARELHWLLSPLSTVLFTTAKIIQQVCNIVYTLFTYVDIYILNIQMDLNWKSSIVIIWTYLWESSWFSLLLKMFNEKCNYSHPLSNVIGIFFGMSCYASY